MQKQIGQNYPEAERAQFLADNCDRIEEKSYMKRFDSNTLMQKKEQLSEIAIQISDLEEAKKSYMVGHKAEMDPLQDEKKQLLTDIKQKAEFVKERCYKFIDEDERWVGYYNGAGDLIDSRPANPDELQKTIFQLSRTGTEG